MNDEGWNQYCWKKIKFQGSPYCVSKRYHFTVKGTCIDVICSCYSFYRANIRSKVWILDKERKFNGCLKLNMSKELFHSNTIWNKRGKCYLLLWIPALGIPPCHDSWRLGTPWWWCLPLSSPGATDEPSPCRLHRYYRWRSATACLLWASDAARRKPTKAGRVFITLHVDDQQRRK